ncbi:cGMP-dependent protein kinase, isozyme 2 forms cD4/T1/T3A/T3B-like isoform X1 [Lutzomyia longipalpis]|uniref:cGMP-dependent protein kinase, isozyme 2 forms cD4/T1/T3A/T3B-like isoform X1 n=1 Tax=Lutzomyia longipalpis TaxID=7200 RepID=UPI0024838736|nr:cGMP-dependent protein kinase, isozyme 2 forms cD4/T1/T3A/T3B-like isoform X1 [Lutzomyia longipalpis]
MKIFCCSRNWNVNSRDSVGSDRKTDHFDIISPLPFGTIKHDKNLSSSPLQRRHGIRAEPPSLNFTEAETIPKDCETNNLLRNAILTNDYLKNIMDDTRLQLLVDAMIPGSAEENTMIISEGDEGDAMYVSYEGKFEVLIGNKFMGDFGPGILFGELAILYMAKRFASIRARTNVKFYKLPRQVFQRIMVDTGRRERNDNMRFLKGVETFKRFTNRSFVINRMTDLLRREFYPAGWEIIKQGDIADKFYIIRGGTATVSLKYDNGRKLDVNVLKRGDYFGDRSLITEEMRDCTVTANSPGTECLILDKSDFIRYVDYKVLDQDRKISLTDLSVIGTLGEGGYGRVELVSGPNDERYALKCLKKVDVVQKQLQEEVYSEKTLLKMCDHSFIVKLCATFRDTRYVYFLMEPCLGGDLWTLLQKKRKFRESHAKFYLACVISAIEYLHSKNIIYRDLKLENLMLDSSGYLKLIDLGCSKETVPGEKTYSFVGTAAYMAPEIIMNRGYCRSIDCWSLGVLAFELLTGKAAFTGSTNFIIFNEILRGIPQNRYPRHLSKAAVSLISGLCRVNPIKRLGCQKEGISGLRTHDFFRKFDWKALTTMTMKPPYVPKVKNLTELLEDHKPYVEPPEDFTGWDEGFES